MANFRLIGLIRLILPQAKIIHVVRDPVDTCLSCFMHLFTPIQTFAYDLPELGRYYRQYSELMQHWRQVLPAGAMLEVRYEAVVGDLEGEAPGCSTTAVSPGIPACLSFHKTDRPVRTISNVQVRRPLYRTAPGRGGVTRPTSVRFWPNWAIWPVRNKSVWTKPPRRRGQSRFARSRRKSGTVPAGFVPSLERVARHHGFRSACPPSLRNYNRKRVKRSQHQGGLEDVPTHPARSLPLDPPTRTLVHRAAPMNPERFPLAQPPGNPPAAATQAQIAALAALADREHRAGRLAAAAEAYGQILRLQPGLAEAHNNLGNVLVRSGPARRCAVHFQTAARLRPTLLAAHDNQGNILKRQRKLDEAAAAYQIALALDGNLAEVHNNLAAVQREQGKFQQALAHLEKALALKPNYPEPHLNLGNLLRDHGRLEDARTWYQRARPEAGLCRKRNYRWACFICSRGFRARLARLRGSAAPARGPAAPEPAAWTGQPLADRTLLLLAEQGLGDVFQFIRFARSSSSGRSRGAGLQEPVSSAADRTSGRR